MDRAYALLHVKSFDLEARTFAGMASTPELDRQGHVVDPAGVTFANPLPLLLHHNQEHPIGRVTLSRVSDGIAFEAMLPTIDQPGRLRDRVDEAWQSIKAGLITGVSIGYRILDGAIERLKDGGLKLLKTEIVELSLVTIPANTQASIRLVKSLAVSRPVQLAVAGASHPGARMKPTTAEHIKSLENSRAAQVARMVALQDGAAEAGTTLAEPESIEYDELALKVKSIDADLVRFRALEQTQIAAATPVPNAASPVTSPVSIQVKTNLDPTTPFCRLVLAHIAGKGSRQDAINYAARWNDSTPEVQLALKAATAPATTTDPTWMGVLVPPPVVKGFIELLRPKTILGRLAGLNQVPFNVLVPMQTGGGTYSWVGENAPKPVTKFTLGSTTLTWSKIAAIIALSEELTRLSTPSAEDVVRREMVNGIAQFMDQQFIDPTVAAVAGVSPASITNGITPITTTADPVKDVTAILMAFTAANIPVDRITLIMSSTTAFQLAVKLNALGQPMFPSLTATGGTIFGIPVIPSNAAGNNVIGVAPEYILYADEGGTTIDVSREASVQLNSAPDNPGTATTVLVSFWQQNLVGIKAERFVNWKRAINAAVQYVGATAYPLAAGLPEGQAGEPMAQEAAAPHSRNHGKHAS